MATEIIYLGHDNSIDFVLKANGTAVDLGSVTRMTLKVGSVLVDSANGGTDPILWDQEGYALGEVRLFLGGQSISPGQYENAWLTVYDPTNVEGVVWGSFMVEVLADVEA